MKYIFVTENLTSTHKLINTDNIIFISEGGGNSSITFIGGHTIYVKESMSQIYNLIRKSAYSIAPSPLSEAEKQPLD